MKPTTISAFAVVLFFTLASQASAAGLVPCGGAGEAACNLCFLFSMVKKAVDFIFFSIIPPVAALIIILSGVNLIANKNSPETVNKSKKILFSTFIGLGIIFSGWVVVNTVLSAMNVTAWQGNEGKWWKFTLTCSNEDAGIYYEEGDLEVCKGQENQ